MEWGCEKNYIATITPSGGFRGGGTGGTCPPLEKICAKICQPILSHILYGVPIYPSVHWPKSLDTSQIYFSLATLARIGNPCTLILKGITITKHCIVVNAECIARYTIILFIFIKVDASQINHLGREITLEYIDCTGNFCTPE